MPADAVDQRFRFFLRIVCAKFSHLFQGKAPVIGRGIIAGVETYLEDVFGEGYEFLNRRLVFVYVETKEFSDKDLWREILLDDMRYHAPVRMLILSVLPFEKFGNAMRFVIGAVNKNLPENHPYMFDEKKFHVLFACWFGDLFRFVADAGDRFDPVYGAGMRERILGIHREFLNHAPPNIEALAATAGKE